MAHDNDTRRSEKALFTQQLKAYSARAKANLKLDNHRSVQALGLAITTGLVGGLTPRAEAAIVTGTYNQPCNNSTPNCSSINHYRVTFGGWGSFSMYYYGGTYNNVNFNLVTIGPTTPIVRRAYIKATAAGTAKAQAFSAGVTVSNNIGGAGNWAQSWIYWPGPSVDKYMAVKFKLTPTDPNPTYGWLHVVGDAAVNGNGESQSLTIKEWAYESSGGSIVTGDTGVASNNAPTVSGAPASITVTEDTVSDVNLSAVSFADSDGDSLTVTLTAGSGTMTASSGGGVTVGGSGTGALTLAGTAANINTFLDTVTNIKYTGASNVSGTAATTLTISCTDGTNSLASDPVVDIDITAVNDDPTISGLPASITVTEETAGDVDFSAATFGDVDSGGASISLIIATGAGTGTLAATSGGGVKISGSGSMYLTLTGTAAAIDTFLNTASNIQYTGALNVSGTMADTLTLTANDGGNTGSGGGGNVSLGTVDVNINGVNDDPAITGLPTDITVVEDTAGNVDLSAVTFTDVDSGANSITLTLAAGVGTLTATSGGGVTVGGSGSSTLTLSGTVTNIDTFLNTASNIKYTGVANANGSNATTLTLTANDGGNTGTGGGTNVSLGTVNVNVTAVNDAPTLSGTHDLGSTNEDVTSASVAVSTILAGPSISYSDPDNGALSGIAVTGFTGSGTWKYDDGLDNWTAFGAVSGGAALLLDSATSVRFVPDPDANGLASFTFRGWDQTSGTPSGSQTPRYLDTSDNGGSTSISTGSATANLTVNPVNDPPVITTNTGMTVAEGSVDNVIGNTMLAVTDPDNVPDQITYAVTALPVEGPLYLNGTPMNRDDTFSPGHLNLGMLTYSHNGNEPHGDSFTFSVTDPEGPAVTNQTFTITVTPVNDPPVISTNLGTTVVQGANNNLIDISLLAASDPDNTSAELTFTLETPPSHGTLRLGGTPLNATDTFSQSLLVNLGLRNDHDGTTADPDSFRISVSDLEPLSSGIETFSITVLSDGDGDGVADIDDNCPLIANQNQSDVNSNDIGDVCDTGSDTDNDTLSDADESVLYGSNPDNPNSDGDSIGDLEEVARGTVPGIVTSQMSLAVNEVADFNGDLMDDLLLRDTISGSWQLIQLDGASIIGDDQLILPKPLSWQPLHVGDFNGDGMADALFRNLLTGDWRLGIFAGATRLDYGKIPLTTKLDWQTVGFADFDGDTKRDVVMRHQVTGEWNLVRLDGRTKLGSDRLRIRNDLDWQPQYIGDFNDDGKSDIMLRNTVSGEWELHLFDGATRVDWFPVSMTPDLNWQPQRFVDFNDDGQRDVVLRNQVSGLWNLVSLDGGANIASNRLSTRNSLDWQPLFIGDFDADGQGDLLLRLKFLVLDDTFVR